MERDEITRSTDNEMSASSADDAKKSNTESGAFRSNENPSGNDSLETSKMKTLKIKHLTAKISKGISMKTSKKILTKALKNRIQMRTLKKNS